MSKKLDIYLKDTVNEMIESLKYECGQCNVDVNKVKELFKDHRINDLDELFNDGGEIRCEKFSDLSWEYALQFGKFDSDEFNNAHWKAVERAMDKF